MSHNFQLKSLLETFPKSNGYHLHKGVQFFYSNGIRYLINHTPSEWLLDYIADLYLNPDPFMKSDNFFTIRLTTSEGNSNVLVVIHNSMDKIIHDKAFLDQPFPFSITLKMVNRVLMLPSEYVPPQTL